VCSAVDDSTQQTHHLSSPVLALSLSAPDRPRTTQSDHLTFFHALRSYGFVTAHYRARHTAPSINIGAGAVTHARLCAILLSDGQRAISLHDRTRAYFTPVHQIIDLADYFLPITTINIYMTAEYTLVYG
jgi:hypothetical protein